MGLFNSTILDVIIGLIFIYLLLSILCTAANEWVAALGKRRAKTLMRGIDQLLANQPLTKKPLDKEDSKNQPVSNNATSNDKPRPDEKDPNALIKAFKDHALIKTMFNGEKPPTYLSPRNFSTTLTDILTAAHEGTSEFENLVKGINDLPDGKVKESLLALLRHSDPTIDDARFAIEGWFNDAMDRVSGWYKRRTQLWTIVIAAVLTLVANADTIQITRKLWTDPVLRSVVVEDAKVRAQQARPTGSPDPNNPTATRNEGNQLSDKDRDLLGQLIGWHSGWRENWSWFTPLGWLLTVLAISMGAPFWFDMLNKIMNIRFAGKSPDERAKVPEKSGSTVRA